MTVPGVVYRMRDAGGALLYVGVTTSPATRIAHHAPGKPWWREVSRIDLEHFETREEAAAAEVVAIRDESPRYNRVRPQREWTADELAARRRLRETREVEAQIALRNRKQRVANRSFDCDAADKVAELLADQGWTPRDLEREARRLGRKASYSSVYRLLRTGKTPNVATQLGIASTFGLKPSDIWTRNEAEVA